MADRQHRRRHRRPRGPVGQRSRPVADPKARHLRRPGDRRGGAPRVSDRLRRARFAPAHRQRVTHRPQRRARDRRGKILRTLGHPDLHRDRARRIGRFARGIHELHPVKPEPAQRALLDERRLQQRKLFARHRVDRVRRAAFADLPARDPQHLAARIVVRVRRLREKQKPLLIPAQLIEPVEIVRFQRRAWHLHLAEGVGDPEGAQLARFEDFEVIDGPAPQFHLRAHTIDILGIVTRRCALLKFLEQQRLIIPFHVHHIDLEGRVHRVFRDPRTEHPRAGPRRQHLQLLRDLNHQRIKGARAAEIHPRAFCRHLFRARAHRLHVHPGADHHLRHRDAARHLEIHRVIHHDVIQPRHQRS